MRGLLGRLPQLHRYGCMPLLGAHQISQEYDTCVDAVDAFMLYLSDNPEIEKVILVSRWAIYAMGKRFRNEKDISST